MKKILLAAVAAVFACAVHANTDKAAAVAPVKLNTPEECAKALAACNGDAECEKTIKANPSCK